MRELSLKEKMEIKKKGYVLGKPDDDLILVLDDAKVHVTNQLGISAIIIEGIKDSAGKGYKSNMCVDVLGALILCKALEVATNDGTMMTCGSLSSWKDGETTVVLEGEHGQFISTDREKCADFIRRVRLTTAKFMSGLKTEDWTTIEMEGYE